MAQNKAHLFKRDEILLADLAKALSHPARIAILKILLQENVCMCGDVVQLIPLAQATVSQHLKELKRVGLIIGEVEGPKICYCLNHEMIQKAMKSFESLFKSICQC